MLAAARLSQHFIPIAFCQTPYPACAGDYTMKYISLCDFHFIHLVPRVIPPLLVATVALYPSHRALGSLSSALNINARERASERDGRHSGRCHECRRRARAVKRDKSQCSPRRTLRKRTYTFFCFFFFFPPARLYSFTLVVSSSEIKSWTRKGYLKEGLAFSVLYGSRTAVDR